MDLGARSAGRSAPSCASARSAACAAAPPGVQATLARKARGRAAVLRHGVAYVLTPRRRGGRSWAAARRKGLLGGMAEPPTGGRGKPATTRARAMLDAPLDARWQRLPGAVRHVFTHFPLELTVFLGQGRRAAPPAPDGLRWTARGATRSEEALAGRDAARFLRTPWSGERIPLSSRAGASRSRRRGRGDGD